MVRKNWHLAQIKPNAHRLATQNLARQGLTTFLPLIEETKAKGSRFFTKTRPLFPGYLFVRADFSQVRSINSTVGICRLVSFGNAPAIVPDGLVAELKSRCTESAVYKASTSISHDTLVKLRKGPFTNFLATVDTCGTSKRAWLLIDLMGRQTRIEVDVSAVDVV